MLECKSEEYFFDPEDCYGAHLDNKIAALKIINEIEDTDEKEILYRWLTQKHQVIITSKRIIKNAASIFGLEWDMWDNPPTRFKLPQDWGIIPVNLHKEGNTLEIFYHKRKERLFVFQPDNETQKYKENFSKIAEVLFDGYMSLAYHASTKEPYLKFYST